MRLALSGTELPDGAPLAPLIDAAHANGIDAVELWHPKNTAAGVGETLARLEDAGIAVACVATGSELYRRGGSAADHELLLSAIDIAERAGARFVNTYFGYAEERDDEHAIATYTRLLQPCLRRAAGAGVTIVLENEFNAFGVDPRASDVTRRPQALARLFEAVGDPRFRLNFDASNFYCAGIVPYPDAFEHLAPYIGYVHVKDVRRINQPLGRGDTLDGWHVYVDYDERYVTCALGDGVVDWPLLLEALELRGYDDFLTLEPHSETALLPQAWAQSAAWIRAGWTRRRGTA